MEKQLDAIFVSSLALGLESVQVYDSNTGANIKSYRGICAAPNTLNCIGKSDYLVSAQKDKPLLQIWAINKHDTVEKRFPIPGKVNVLAVNEIGPKYIAMGIREKIYIYNLLYGQSYGVIARHYQNVTCIKFVDGEYFASGGDDGFVYLWSIASMVESLHKIDKPQVLPHFTLGQHSDKVSGLTVSSYGRRGILISSSLDSAIKVFDLVTGELRHNLILSGSPTAIMVNTLGTQLYMGEKTGMVKAINLLPIPETEDVEVKEQGVVCHEKEVTCLGLTACSSVLITGGVDGDVKVWRISNQTNLAGNLIISLAFERTLQHGRGAITNILCQPFSRDVFNTLEFDSRISINEFRRESEASILDTSVIIPIKKREEENLISELYASAMDLLKTTDVETKSQENGTKIANNPKKSKRAKNKKKKSEQIKI